MLSASDNGGHEYRAIRFASDGLNVWMTLPLRAPKLEVCMATYGDSSGA